MEAHDEKQSTAAETPTTEDTDMSTTANETAATDYVKALSAQQITTSDLATAVRVLEAVAALKKEDGGLDAYKDSSLRALRKVLAGCYDLHRQTMFNGMDEDAYYEQKMQQRSLKRQKYSENAMQKKYLANTALRKGRVEKLRQLQESAVEEEQQKLLAMVAPDGHVDTQEFGANTPMLLENDTPGDTSDTKKPATNDSNDVKNAATTAEQPDSVKLPKLRSCYVCKVRFRDLHHFYDQLCPTCAPLNWQKRHQTTNLHGRVAIITGSRVKIGLQVCLKLLRAGATVIATTRFPNSAAQVYQQQPDFDTFKDRLHIYGFDLRDTVGLEAFTHFLKNKFEKQGIDILINNACQTVRRPVAYYLPLVEQEQKLWEQADTSHKSLLTGCMEFERVRKQMHQNNRINNSNTSNRAILDAESSAIVTRQPSNDDGTTHFETSGLSHSAAMSQMAVISDDTSAEHLPSGVTDINGHQLDLRTTNSWLLKMDQVSTPELMECMLINAIAPFVLNSRLQPLMTTPNERPDRFIINVSAMEGKFYRYKMPNHPHTNMAKAALNMMTRTSAEDLAKNCRIYMNAVDTGWINDENPTVKAQEIAQTNHFQTPIDEVDAAARILDPVFNNKKEYGKFLKDYKETEW